MKTKTTYKCTNCGNISPKWMGKCYSCGEWDTYVEETVTKSKSPAVAYKRQNPIVRMKDINSETNYRILTGINELDRVLGGGIIPGSLVLVGGDPGIGKSTLLLQMACRLEKLNPLYVTGEESLQQIKHRSQRLKDKGDHLLMLAETNIEEIQQAIVNSDSELIIVDSIQSVFTDRIDSTPGSIVQVRECASLLMQTAKASGKAIFIIGHVTKDGFIAGPKILEHLVDTVLQFEGDKSYSYRMLRALKNRYGSTNELGIFEMSGFGLEEVSNPSEIFLSNRISDASGVAVVAAIEGSRPILLEVQALVTPTGYSVPQRTSNGFDPRRLQMVLAVLEKRLGIQFQRYDVFINIAGGIYLNDPSGDLAVASAIYSSWQDTFINPKTVIIGEIGLTGEVRQVAHIEQRISETAKLGFNNAIIPKGTKKSAITQYNIHLYEVDRISLAFNKIFS